MMAWKKYLGYAKTIRSIYIYIYIHNFVFLNPKYKPVGDDDASIIQVVGRNVHNFSLYMHTHTYISPDKSWHVSPKHEDWGRERERERDQRQCLICIWFVMFLYDWKTMESKFNRYSKTFICYLWSVNAKSTIFRTVQLVLFKWTQMRLLRVSCNSKTFSSFSSSSSSTVVPPKFLSWLS